MENLLDIVRECAVTACLAAAALTADILLAQTDITAIKVMSFNIRFGTAEDGENRWQRRQELVAETIRVFDPDLLGLQEALAFQGDFLKQQFPEYDFFGRGRELDPQGGEFCAVMYRRDRFEQRDGGHFWLSETPHEPGSLGWDAELPRMVTWVALRDRTAGTEFVFANTHYDHVGEQARVHSSRVIQQWLRGHAGRPVVLCGDFNCPVDSPPYQTLTGKVTGKTPDSHRPLLDSYRVIHRQATADEGTFGGWTGQRGGNRIDWILHTEDFVTLNAAIDYHQDGKRFPSDHYPVRAVIRVRK